MERCDMVTLNKDSIARYQDRAMVIRAGQTGLVTYISRKNYQAQFFANLETWEVTFRKGDGTVKGF